MARKFNYKYLKQVEKHGRPRNLCIIGEQHWNKTSTLEEADLIKKLKPEYVLMEGLVGSSEEEACACGDMVKQSTVVRLLKRSGETIDNDFFKEMMAEIERQILEKHGEVTDESKRKYLDFHFLPNSLKELKNLPAHSLPDLLLDLLTERYGIEFYRYKSARGISKLSILLCAAGEIGAKLAPCDSEFLQAKAKTAVIKNSELGRELYDALFKEKYGPYKAKRAKKEEKRSHTQRERYMAQAMVEYVKKRKTKKPVVAIVGRAHVKSGHIQRILRKNNIGYACFLDTSD